MRTDGQTVIKELLGTFCDFQKAYKEDYFKTKGPHTLYVKLCSLTV